MRQHPFSSIRACHGVAKRRRVHPCPLVLRSLGEVGSVVLLNSCPLVLRSLGVVGFVFIRGFLPVGSAEADNPSFG